MATTEEIVILLREAAAAYYNGDELKMDDDVYDGLVERLKQMDPEHPFLDEVGAPPPQGAVALPHPMPSLDKIKPGEDALRRFLQGGGFVMSEKLDGLSALWDKNRLYLRGDGLVGQDVTYLVALGIQGLPKSAVPVRGELIIPRSEGKVLGRSWVNGQIHQNNPEAAEVSKIHFIAYEIMGSGMSRSKQFEWLGANRFEVPWFSVTGGLTEDMLAAILQQRRHLSPYDTDGIVVGYDAPPKSESTAAKAKNPKDCVAFKMPLADQSAETIVKEVIWSPSAQGYLIPRIRFDPVKIGSAKIEFCTGHNARMIVLNKVGPGSRVVIRRSGDVIPKLDRVLVATEASLPPEDTWMWDGPAATAVHIKTLGEPTTAKLHYFLKTLGIPGAGPATASALVEAGITGPAGLWAASAETLSKALGPKTGASLHANLRTALAKVSEATLMVASSAMPRGVGETKLTSLFAACENPNNWATLSAPAGWTADSFGAFLKEFPNYVAWRKELSWIPYPILRTPPAKPTGEVICMTGFRDKMLEEYATKRGHTFVPSFTGKVTILLVPDGPIKESEKVKAARTKGTKILTRTQFMQYLS